MLGSFQYNIMNLYNFHKITCIKTRTINMMEKINKKFKRKLKVNETFPDRERVLGL